MRDHILDLKFKEGKRLPGGPSSQAPYLVHRVHIHLPLLLLLRAHERGRPDQQDVGGGVFVDVDGRQDAAEVGADLGDKHSQTVRWTPGILKEVETLYFLPLHQPRSACDTQVAEDTSDRDGCHLELFAGSCGGRWLIRPLLGEGQLSETPQLKRKDFL